MRVEEEIALRWRVPWPLPAAPALRLRVASGLAVSGTATPDTPRLPPHTHRLAPHVPEAAAPRTRGCNPMPMPSRLPPHALPCPPHALLLQVSGAEVTALPSKLGARVEGQVEASSVEVPWTLELDAVREALARSNLGELQSEANTRTVTATSRTVHVTRSALGEVRVFIRPTPIPTATPILCASSRGL